MGGPQASIGWFLFHGKSQSKMDDSGVPTWLRKPPYPGIARHSIRSFQQWPAIRGPIRCSDSLP
jgi:hypothetical protein